MTDLQARVQEALASTYTLERELGGGGMSRVFLAQERRLGRPVVVKLLSPELAAALSTTLTAAFKYLEAHFNLPSD